MNSQSAFSFVLGYDLFLAWLAYLLAAVLAYLLLLWPLRAVQPHWLQFLLRGSLAAIMFTPTLVEVTEMKLLVPAWFTALYAVLQKADAVVQTSLTALLVGLGMGLVAAAAQSWLVHRQDERHEQQRREAAAARQSREARQTPTLSI